MSDKAIRKANELKLIGLEPAFDRLAVYREIAEAATAGAAETPQREAAIELGDPSYRTESGQVIAPTEAELAKAVQALRNGLARVGRYTVRHGNNAKPGGPVAYVTVSTKAIRTRTKKKPAPVAPVTQQTKPEVKTESKAAAAKK